MWKQCGCHTIRPLGPAIIIAHREGPADRLTRSAPVWGPRGALPGGPTRSTLGSNTHPYGGDDVVPDQSIERPGQLAADQVELLGHHGIGGTHHQLAGHQLARPTSAGEARSHDGGPLGSNHLVGVDRRPSEVGQHRIERVGHVAR